MEVIAVSSKAVELFPKDWEVKTIDELSTKIGSGITPTGGEKVYKRNGRPFVRSQNVGWGKLLLDDIAYIDENTHQKFSGTEIMLDDVLLNISGASIGRSACANETLVGGNVNQHVCIIRTLKAELNPKYLNLFLLSENGQYQIDSFQTSGNRQGLNFGQIKQLRIPMPSIDEQAVIASTLSDIEELISNLENLIAKKRNIKQGALQKLLKPKEGWVKRKLGDVGKCHRGVSYNADRDLYPYDKDITARLLRSNNVQNQRLKFNDLQFVDVKRVKQNQILQENDIVICMANGSKQLVGKSAIFKVIDKNKYTFGAFMGCFRTNETLASNSFIALIFQSYQYRTYIDVLLSGSSINNLKPSDIESIEVFLPAPSVQNKITSIISDMDAEISALEAKLEKYQNIKHGMMQTLLTGRIRLV